MNTEKNVEKYNGWSNYATWRIKLELLDASSIYEECEVNSIYDLSIYLKEYVEDIIKSENTRGGILNLILSYAHAFISDVNWYEIATHKAEEYPNIIKKSLTNK